MAIFALQFTAQEALTSHDELFQKSHLVLIYLNYVVLLYVQYEQYQILAMREIGAFVCF